MKKVIQLSKEEEQRALDLHRRYVFINTCDSTSLKDNNEVYFSQLLETGISAMCTTVYAYPERPATLGPLHEFLSAVGEWYHKLEASSNAVLATTTEDITNAKRSSKLAIVFATQNGDFIYDLELIKVFRRLGLRIVQPTYQRRNLIGDGCGEKNPAGLSTFGVKAIEQMGREGIVIDLSHVGKPTTLDCIRVSTKPVIFSHTAARTLCDVVRAKTDEEIKALAEKSGVMGITPKSNFLRPNGQEKGTTIEDYMDHIDYVVKLVGVDHVGVGLDIGDGHEPYGKYNLEHMKEFDSQYPEIGIWKKGLQLENMHVKEVSPPLPKVLNITRGAVARGYSDQEIEKILGGNFLRVFQRVWVK
jgi:microsomal dipeptidase-like Zn-dependent dipeptidase